MNTKLSLILAFLLGFSGMFLSQESAFADWGCAWNWGTSCNQPGEISYCQGNDCSIVKGEEAISNATGNLLSKKSISVFITDLVKYFLSFVTLIGVLYVLFAGFQIMTGAGDEEKTKKARQIIIYVFVGIIVMWLAYWIVILILDAIR